ncbi:MAG: hypothetical protein AMR96_04750 [Candidatus Adiutrix intracellularis]|nr:MAG: hypothetical protein AMR96_04750 [Candidatus Adiutrix intracellularis]
MVLLSYEFIMILRYLILFKRKVIADRYLELVDLPGDDVKLLGELLGGNAVVNRYCVGSLAVNAFTFLMGELFGALDEMICVRQLW